MGTQDRFDQGLAALHAAGLGEADWQHAIAGLCDALDADGNQIAIVSDRGSTAEVTFSAAYAPRLDWIELEREYLADFFPTDERVPRLLSLRHGRIVPNSEMYTDLERSRTSATWNDFLCKLGTANQLNVRLDGPSGTTILWVLSRHIHSPDWQRDDIEMASSLLPHIVHAVRVRQALAAAEAVGASVARQLDSPLLAVMLLDQWGRILHASQRARQILCESDGLSDRGGVLQAHLGNDNKRLGKLVAAAIPRFSAGATGGSISVERPSCLPPYKLCVSPIHDRSGDCGGQRAAAIVWIVDPAAKTHVPPQPLENLLGLTAAQSRVAAALAEGRPVREIADVLRIEESTVRWHLKQVFARTGSHSQSDLVRLVLSVSAAC